jgi:hypothetical protein
MASQLKHSAAKPVRALPVTAAILICILAILGLTTLPAPALGLLLAKTTPWSGFTDAKQ